MWYKNVGTNFFHFVTIHAFDRGWTERRTDRRIDIWLMAIQCVALRAVAR